MLYATNIFPGDGSTRQFEITFVGGYLNKSHVKVYVEDAVTKMRRTIDMGTVTWIGPYTIQLPEATPVGSNTVIARQTPLLPIVDFQGSSRITEANLDVAHRQGLFVATESLDSTNSKVVEELKEVLLNTETWEQATADAATASAQAGVATTKAAEAASSAAASAASVGALALSTGSGNVGHIGSGTGAVATTVGRRLRETVSVLEYIPLTEHAAIASGTSTYDCSTAVQSAITAAYGRILLVPMGRYILNTVSVAGNTELVGEPGSVFVHKASGGSSMLTISGVSTKFKVTGITFDGNEASQNGATKSISHSAVGTGTDPSEFIVTDCHFVNGDYSDISITTDYNLLTFDTVQICGNTFFGGREGTSTVAPRYIHISSACDIQITGNNFNLGYTPATYGRAGIVSFLSGYSGQASRGLISGNFMRNIGRSAPDALGAIDGYSGCQDMVIDGNTIINPYGRGIQVKSDARDIVVSNNIVNGLHDLHGGTGVDAQITVNRLVSTNGVGGSILVTGNVCNDSGWDGISMSAASDDYASSADNIVVSANIVSSALRRGIGVYNTKHAAVQGNIVTGGCSQYGVIASGYLSPSATLVTGNMVSGVSGIGIYCSVLQYLTVSSNMCRSNVGVDLYITTIGAGIVSENSFLSDSPVNTGLASGVENVVFKENTCTSLLAAGLYRKTIATGVITATFPFMQVANEGATAADDLTTINGGYEGMCVTLRAYSAAQVVTVLGGGNLVLSAPMILSTPLKTISLVKFGASWYETSRSSNV